MSNTNKKCCKNCDKLNYYDWYFCDLQNKPDNKDDFFIDNIENDNCEMFTKRNGKFWLYSNADF